MNLSKNDVALRFLKCALRPQLRQKNFKHERKALRLLSFRTKQVNLADFGGFEGEIVTLVYQHILVKDWPGGRNGGCSWLQRDR